MTLRKVKSAYPVGIDVPGRRFEGEIVTCHYGYGFVRCDGFPDIYFHHRGHVEWGDTITFEIGQRPSGELTVYNLEKVE